MSVRYSSAMFFEQFCDAAGTEFPYSDEWLRDVPGFLREIADSGSHDFLRHLIRLETKPTIPLVLDMGEKKRMTYIMHIVALGSSYGNLDYATDYYSERARMASHRRNTASPEDAYRDPETRLQVLRTAYQQYALQNPKTVPRPCLASNETMAKYFARQAIYMTLKECGNFKISFAAQIYSLFGATAVLDPFAGWGDRAIAAALVPTVQRYLGVDSNVALAGPYSRIKATFDKQINFLVPEKFENAEIPYGFDLILASPPFFDLEVYGTAGAPTDSVASWVNDWLVPCLLKALSMVVPGGHLVLYLCDNRRDDDSRYAARCHEELMRRSWNRITFLGVIATLREKDTRRVMPLFIYQKN